MSISSQAIERIGKVRHAASDPRSAYLIRSRLRRALLTSVRAVAEKHGVEKPALPGQWISSADGADDAHVVELCKRIYRESEHLCQPSESFDVRWEDGWNRLQHDLAQLELALGQLEM